MKPFTFVHAADLHLDSPFKGVTAEAPEVAELLRKATFRAFEALVDLCVQRSPRFLLLAGDVFDWADQSLRAQLALRDGLQRLSEAGILVFMVRGNHDPMESASDRVQWPAGVHVFGHEGGETRTVEVDGVPTAAVAGISYKRQRESRNLAKMFSPSGSGLFHVGLLHCNVGSDTGHEPYAPCELDDLFKAGMDYWALGHVHERRILSRAPWVVYPGNTQGRSIREPGPRGCYVVDVDAAGGVDPEFVPLDAVRWGSRSVSIDGLEGFDELENALSAAIEACAEEGDGRPLVCRLTLTGRGPLTRELRKEGIRRDLLERVREGYATAEPMVWVEALQVACQPEVDLENRAAAGDLLGEVLKIAREMRESGNLKGALEGCLSDLYAHHRAHRHLDPLSAQELDALLRNAELLCLDLLEEDE